MSSRRPSVVADRQDARLERLRVARQDRPGRPASVEPEAVPILALVAALELALELARLGRMQATDSEDADWRRLVVVVGAVASAVTSDVRNRTTESVDELYSAISAYQRTKGDA